MESTRKKIIFCLSLSVCVFAWGLVFADQPFTTIQTMRSAVRNAKQDDATTPVSEADLTLFCHQSLINVSTDIGGIEMKFRVVTVANTRFYAIPDSICRILNASVINGKYTQELKQIPPQYLEDVEIPVLLEATATDNVPQAFHYWDDTLQLMPVPTRVDTVVLNCYVEHPADSTIQLEGGYCDAALYDAVARWYEATGMYSSATYWKGEYAKKKAALIEAYTRRFEQRPQSQQKP